MVLGLALASTIGFGSMTQAHASSGASVPQLFVNGESKGTPQFTTVGSAKVLSTTKTIPYWSSSFTSNGVTYPYQMVGANPAGGTSTTITNEIIPLRFVFADGTVYDGNKNLANVLNSPVYKPSSYNPAYETGAATQYGDAAQRATFNASASSNYHVLLGAPSILPTQTITVPADQGVEYSGVVAFANLKWFNAQLQNLLGQMHIDPTTLPIFLTDSVLLQIPSPQGTGCCILGYH